MAQLSKKWGICGAQSKMSLKPLMYSLKNTLAVEFLCLKGSYLFQKNMMAEEVARNVVQVLMRKCALNNYSHCGCVDTICSHISKELHVKFCSKLQFRISEGFVVMTYLWCCSVRHRTDTIYIYYNTVMWLQIIFCQPQVAL